MDIILTIYYTNKKDPQRDKFVEKNSFSYIKNFYLSVKSNNLNCIIFYDDLTDDFINQYTTKYIKFHKFYHDNYPTNSGNDTRFLVYLEYLKNIKDIENIIICDVNGPTILNNPFNAMNNKSKLYVVPSRTKNRKGVKRYLNNPWMKDYIIRAYGSFNKLELFSKEIVLQAGLFGGSYNMIINLLEIMEKEFEIANIEKNTNMAVYQYVIRTYFNDKIIIASSSHDGHRENIDPTKTYLFKTRIANIYSFIAF